MIGLSIYLGGNPCALEKLQKALFVSDKNCYEPTDNGVDYSFFDRKESAFQYNRVYGDFQFSIDMYIFGFSEADLDNIFIKISGIGVTVAIPDEKSENPFGFIIYRNGEKERRFINEIEEDGEDKLIISNRY